MLKKNKKKILYIINHTAFFVSHRLPLAEEARKLNYKISLITGVSSSKTMEKNSLKIIKRKKIKFKRSFFSSSSLNIFSEFFGLCQIIYHCKKIKPDIIHTASPKANILGGIVAKLINVPCLVISVSGQGHIFTEKKKMSNFIISKFYKIVLKFILKHKNKKIILQNSQDYKEYCKLDKKKNCILIPGSGVDTKKFDKINPICNSKNILLPSRILKDKGVLEFVEAAKIIKKKYPDWNFVIVGPIDYNNPSAIPKKHLKKWVKEKIIKWIDYTTDIVKIYKNSSIVCLPSHREGFSKVLIEAGASARPVVTSDVPGCREAIKPGFTGEVFKLNNQKQLEQKIVKLINNKKLRLKYGNYGRKFVKKNFEIKKIIKKNLEIYNCLIKNV